VAIPSIIRIFRTEGVGALFLGFPAKVAMNVPSFITHCSCVFRVHIYFFQVLRLGPGGGIMMAAFELAKGVFQ
jgi:hypothetical protein